MTNKTYGVCVGLLALGLVGLGAPASHAASRLAAGEAGGGSETDGNERCEFVEYARCVKPCGFAPAH